MFLIHEPDVTLTDYALAVECAGFAVWLFVRGDPGSALRRWFTLFFGSLSLAALLGGTVHGFFPDEAAPGYRILWPATLIVLGLTVLAGWGLAARTMFSERTARRITRAAGLLFIGYAVVIVFVKDSYFMVILHYLPPLVFLFAAWLVTWRRTGATAVLTGVLGLALTFAAAGVQLGRVALHPVYFNHNALYHLIQAAAFFMIFCCARWFTTAMNVNDIHSQLNATRVYGTLRPASVAAIQSIIRNASKWNTALSVTGRRHAMGGQQFGADTLLIDLSGMNRIVSFDSERGLIEAGAGIEWPALVDFLLRAQNGQWPQWGIIQKQTGADRLSLGGALSANVHGRGLRLRPFIADVEAFTLVDAQGSVRRCSRTENPALFSLAAGGFGLFGVIATVTLRLARRKKLERVVEIIELKELIAAFERRIAEGCLFGDFQYSTDCDSGDFLRRGVFSCYRPVSDDTPMPENQKEMAPADWDRLYHLAHTDKRKTWEFYSGYYLSTSGQLYWSDTHQMNYYRDHYHELLDKTMNAAVRGTEMITEVYASRDSLASLMESARREFLEKKIPVIYGTIRLIEKDDESFMPWARESYACVIFNIHVDHSPVGLTRAAGAFRFLIDAAIRCGGSYYLTYHRWATREQVLACYPEFPEFLRLKREYDPEERFQSDWYRHYRAMFADELRAKR